MEKVIGSGSQVLNLVIHVLQDTKAVSLYSDVTGAISQLFLDNLPAKHSSHHTYNCSHRGIHAGVCAVHIPEIRPHTQYKKELQ